jgi:hypothetical protein
MRISFRLPGYVYDEQTDQVVTDPSALSALNGWHYDEDCIYNYLGMELVDQGVVGGIIRLTWMSERGLEVITDFWAPDSLQSSAIKQLRDQTAGQLSDGIGEGGFEIALKGRKMVIVADTDRPLDVEQVYDGKPIPKVSRIAQTARDGNIPLLEDAIASGEAIDSEIQGYSGLHLAIIYGQVNAALLLISKGANVNKVVGSGDETPIHLCALSNSMNDSQSATVAEALLRHGADKSVATVSGNTAASFAEIRHKPAMLAILREGENEG